ncbi:MAG: AAA family ATPase [Myxococcales bacterium]
MSKRQDQPGPSASEAGTVLAQRYRVVRELGRGGMGVVYFCDDTLTGERVALKRLRIPDDTASARPEESWWFHQEARAVANLDHPAIVRARDFGSLADGSPFLAMDVLPGRSVHEWMHTTQLPWSVIWAMMDQALAGLAHAHARGIIHGDLKPSNVMLDLGSTGRGPRAFLLDLGLAWLRRTRYDPRLDGSDLPELALHAGAGTVGWVAPEQIRKLTPMVGPPTDLYALGCILYRVLTGSEVFDGNAQEVLRAHKRTPIPAISLPEEIPEGVGPFLLRLLEKQPWHRFEFAADARRVWLSFKPPHARTLEANLSGYPPAPLDITRLSPGLLSLRLSPFVARAEERRLLLEAAEEVVGTSTPLLRLVALIGAAGIGKSRLAEWLGEQMHETAKMVPLRARYGRIPTPLDGVTGAVNAHFGLEGVDRLVVEQTLLSRWEIDKNDDEGLTSVAATVEWLRPTPPGVLPPLGPTGKRFILDQPKLRWVVVRRVLERIGRDRPVLLWLDDLHYGSANTFDMLSSLRRSNPSLRLLVVATARSEALATDLDAALRVEAFQAEWNGRVVELGPLGSLETQGLLRSALPLDDDALARAVSQSRGNPLFALQLLYAWAGGGYLTLKDGRYHVPPDALEGRPITTSELWDERLRGIATELRLAAYAAAALGEDIRGDILKSLVLSLGMNPRDALVALTRAQMLLAAGSDQYRWAHALLQEHLLARLGEREDAPAIYRLAAVALSKHPAVGSRRIMKHRVTNLLRAGDDNTAAKLLFDFIRGSWQRGRDTAATLRDLEMLDGRVTGAEAAESAMWRAEALRFVGKLDEARLHAEIARDGFRALRDLSRESEALRLLGHIASDLGAPAQARAEVVVALERFVALGNERERAQTEVVLGEIDYLLGEHAEAKTILTAASARCTAVGDPLGRAQCLILLALIEGSLGDESRMRGLLAEARAEFDAIGYRLGVAQCDVALAHADHRAFDLGRARARALAARASFRELQNPRGEAGCERLLAMIALDADDAIAALAHVGVAGRLYDRLRDPWGEVEARCLRAQVALATGDPEAPRWVAECEEIDLDEAEPRQHRHLTAAWLAQTRGRWADAAAEVDRARTAFPERGRTGDHTPHLLLRFSKMVWIGPSVAKIDTWLEQVLRAGAKR